MDEIGAAVGLLKASVYHYFHSKEEILYKITKPPIEIGVGVLGKIVESELTPKEKLQKAIQYHVEQLDQLLPRFFMLSEQDLNCVSAEMRDEVLLLMVRYVSLWREIITEGISSGQFRADVNSKLVTFSIIGMCNYLFGWYKKGGTLSVAQVSEQFMSLVSGGLFTDSTPDIPPKPLRKFSRSES
jgi:AcrR family transcriptional regulator